VSDDEPEDPHARWMYQTFLTSHRMQTVEVCTRQTVSFVLKVGVKTTDISPVFRQTVWYMWCMRKLQSNKVLLTSVVLKVGLNDWGSRFVCTWTYQPVWPWLIWQCIWPFPLDSESNTNRETTLQPVLGMHLRLHQPHNRAILSVYHEKMTKDIAPRALNRM